MPTPTRLEEGLPLDEVARRHWPVNAPGLLADGGDDLSDADRAFFRALRSRSLTAVILCIDR